MILADFKFWQEINEEPLQFKAGNHAPIRAVYNVVCPICFSKKITKTDKDKGYITARCGSCNLDFNENMFILKRKEV